MFASTILPAQNPGKQFRFIGQDRAVKHGFEVIEAKSLFSRLLGLRFIGRSRSPEGIYMENTDRTHTYGMRFPVDLLFLNENREPVIAVREVTPGHRVKVPEATHLIVLPSDWDVEKWNEQVTQESAQ